MLKSIGASCELVRFVDGGAGGGDTDADIVTFFSRMADVVAAVELEWRLTLLELRNEAGGCGDVGGVIETTISSLSMSSSSLFMELLSFGEHCDFNTASKYRLVNSSADLLPVFLFHHQTKPKIKKQTNESH